MHLTHADADQVRADRRVVHPSRRTHLMGETLATDGLHLPSPLVSLPLHLLLPVLLCIHRVAHGQHENWTVVAVAAAGTIVSVQAGSDTLAHGDERAAGTLLVLLNGCVTRAHQEFVDAEVAVARHTYVRMVHAVDGLVLCLQQDDDKEGDVRNAADEAAARVIQMPGRWRSA